MQTSGRDYDNVFEHLIDIGRHLVLPLATVALGLVGQYAILMRSSILETLTEDYVTTARAKGLDEGRVLRHHAIPNALCRPCRSWPSISATSSPARSPWRSSSTGQASERSSSRHWAP